MRAIVSWSLNFRFLVVAAAVAMMTIGISTVRSTPVDVFPEFAPPQVEIQTESLGLSTSDVEQLVTVPLELAMNGMPGLTQMRSTSVPQLSSIVMVFSPSTDLLHARQLVQERLATVRPTLPRWASPPVMLAPVSATARVLQIGMTASGNGPNGKPLTPMELSQLAYWTIKPRLLHVDGVADVSIWDQRPEAFQVQVDPKKMATQQVTLDNVERTTADALDSGALQFSTGAVVGAGGFLDGNGGVPGLDNQRLSVAHQLSVQTPADLAKIPLEDQAAQGKKVTLGQIGEVTQGYQPLIGDAIINGKPGILLVVEKLPWGNTLKITSQVDDALKAMQPGLTGVAFDSHIFRPADFIDDSIHNLLDSLLLGFLLVVVILVLFLFEWRVALISLVSIPLSLTAAVLVLRTVGATVNTMVLAGLIIALGAVVDDAIIDVENILRRLRIARRTGKDGGKSTQSTARIILGASLEVRSPIVYATLIIVAAAVPVFMLHGLTAAFFRPLAFAYTLAIIASMAVALTVTPALTLILLRRAPLKRFQSPLVRVLRRWYDRFLNRIVARPTAAYSVFAAVVLCGALIAPQLGQSLFPTFQQRDLLIHWDAIPGTSDQEVLRTTTQLDAELRAIPGVEDFGAHIGRAPQGEEIVGINAAEVWIHIAANVDYDKTVAKVRAVVDSHPGLYRDVETYLNERIEEVLSGSKEAVTVRVYGQDLAQMRSTAQSVLGQVASVKGVVDPHMDLSVDTPQINVEVNLAEAAKYGLKPGDVRRQAATLVAGQEMGNVFENNQVYGVYVWSIPAVRANAGAIASLPLDTPTGGHIKLSDVASVTLGPDPYLITREDNSRYIDVGANVAGDADLSGVVSQIQARLAANVHVPQGSHYALLGEYEERQQAQQSLLTTAALAGVAIFLLLQLAFGSWRLATLLFVTLPMALVGGLIAVWFGGAEVTIGALVGFFTVFGIAARNGILMINHCQHLENEEDMEFGPDLVVRGASERLAPILMTSLATGLALVPLVIAGNQPGREIEYPLAVVILGGLVSSTLLTLFVVPSLYLRFSRPKRRGSDDGAVTVAE
ncbi:heavy metal efflux pump, CzcA family [Streptacidiphilus jiangxiensis]|uniref:Heavy metal efflux pump, CzcA family n=2 Tax=Streptacidiphilus jiangxiensis TaxID=235985 RepID=A0A1H7S1U9_STRJI|nr:heavy metal efflux pump, CzcA family [Streptacidiphilus jiangxiensis]